MGDKYVVFSFDDGLSQDKRILEILNRHQIKATFNLNSGLFGKRQYILRIGNIGFRSVDGRNSLIDRLFPYADQNRVELEEALQMYAGHEVASHGTHHLDLSKADDQTLKEEVEKDVLFLNNAFHQRTVGLALPFGREVKNKTESLKEFGIEYCRTTRSSYSFAFPKDPMKWDPTCWLIDKKLFSLTKQFVSCNCENDCLLYLWGHGYEMDFNTADSSFARFERLLELLSEDRQIRYVTNKEALNVIRERRQK